MLLYQFVIHFQHIHLDQKREKNSKKFQKKNRICIEIIVHCVPIHNYLKAYFIFAVHSSKCIWELFIHSFIHFTLTVIMTIECNLCIVVELFFFIWMHFIAFFEKKKMFCVVFKCTACNCIGFTEISFSNVMW